MFNLTTRFMFRSTHEALVKSLKDDCEARINAIKQRADEQVKHDEARVQAEKNMVRTLSDELKELKKPNLSGATKKSKSSKKSTKHSA